MKKLLFILLLFFSICGQAEEKGWDVMSEVPYSYAYACTYLGHRMRLQGWRCLLGFKDGPQGKIEHSVWEKGGYRRQLMIWRIDTGRTGYSWKDVLCKGEAEKDAG